MVVLAQYISRTGLRISDIYEINDQKLSVYQSKRRFMLVCGERVPCEFRGDPVFAVRIKNAPDLATLIVNAYTGM